MIPRLEFHCSSIISQGSFVVIVAAAAAAAAFRARPSLQVVGMVGRVAIIGP